MFGCARPGARVGHQHVGFEAEELRGQIGKTSIVPLGPSELDREILALDVAEIAKPSSKRLDLRRIAGRRGGTEEPDPVHFARRLRLAGERTPDYAHGDNGAEESAKHNHRGSPDRASPWEGVKACTKGFLDCNRAVNLVAGHATSERHTPLTE